MKKFILLITILIALASCRSPQQISDRKCGKAQAKYEKAAYRWGCPLVAKSDTVFTTMTIRERHDTTIYVRIKGDTVRSVDTVILVNGIAQSPKNRLDTEFAYSISYVQDGRLYHVLYQKESVIAQTIKDAIQKESHVEYKTITKTVEKKTNYLTQWQILQLWAGRIAILWLLIGFSIRFLRKRWI